MLNKIFLMGRLVADPEMRQTPAGVPVATFRIAVDRDFKNKDTGEREADFVTIVAWRSTAEFVSKYFTKGRMAVVEGRLQVRPYEKDGQRRSATEVVADNVYFGDSRRDDDGGQAGGGYSQGYGSQSRKPASGYPNSDYSAPKDDTQFNELDEDEDDGDLPF